MTCDVTALTNHKTEQFLLRYDASLPTSDKLSYTKAINDTRIKAFIGLMYMRGALKLNLCNAEKNFYHKSSKLFFRATMTRYQSAFL